MLSKVMPSRSIRKEKYVSLSITSLIPISRKTSLVYVVAAFLLLNCSVPMLYAFFLMSFLLVY